MLHNRVEALAHGTRELFQRLVLRATLTTDDLAGESLDFGERGAWRGFVVVENGDETLLVAVKLRISGEVVVDIERSLTTAGSVSPEPYGDRR